MEKIIIQSDINNLIDVERFISTICDLWNINNYSATISVSVLQAVKNAIVHGNHNDASRKVTVTADRCYGGIVVAVSDEGDGFNYSDYGDVPSDDSKGTGIYLMKTLSDKISFSDNGSTVRMEYLVNGIDASHALERITTLHRYYASNVVVA